MIDSGKIINPGMVASDYKVEFNVEFCDGVLQTLQKDPKIDIDKELKLKSSINLTNMHLFKFNKTLNTNVIAKYNTPNEIISDFVEERIGIYILRQAYIVKKLNMELDVLRYKRKYIGEICEDTIVVIKRSEDELVKTLIKKGYPELTHSIDKPCSYDYLTDLKITSCTSTQIAKLDEQIKNKEQYINIYKNKTPAQLWKEELAELEIEYTKFLKEKHELTHKTPVLRLAKRNLPKQGKQVC